MSNHRYNTHVCLVSDKPVTCIAPIIDSTLRPDQAVLVHGPERLVQARWLASTLQGYGLSVELFPVSGPPRVDDLREELRPLAGRLPKETAVNITGGNKPLSIAAYEAFRDAGRSVYYLDPRDERLIWLEPADAPTRSLDETITLDPYLRAHGAEIGAVPSRSPLTDGEFEFADRVLASASLRSALLFLRRVSSGCDSATRELNAAESARLRRVCEPLEALGHVSCQGRRLTFTSEEACDFATGGWLDGYVFTVLCLRAAFDARVQDLLRRVSLLWERDGRQQKCRLPVLALRDNTLYAVDCLAGRPRAGGEGESAEAALDRLETVTGWAGTRRGRGLLVSVTSLTAIELRRAAGLGITVVHGPELRYLAQRVHTWLDGE